MREEAGDGGRILDGRDELQWPAAVRAALDVDIEHALQLLRPTHAPLRIPDRQVGEDTAGQKRIALVGHERGEA